MQKIKQLFESALALALLLSMIVLTLALGPKLTQVFDQRQMAPNCPKACLESLAQTYVHWVCLWATCRKSVI